MSLPTSARSADLSVGVRRFDRRDREQVTDLVNAHVAAVLPGVTVPVATVLATLEREPGEHVVDPWVVDRVTLVAEVRRRVVAVVHLLRYGDGPEVGPGYRDAGEVRWLAALPMDHDGSDLLPAAADLLVAARRVFAAWGVTRVLVDPSLPAPGAHGVPDVWPHLRRLLAADGCAPTRTEVVWRADVEALRRTPAGLATARSVGCVGTRFTARRGEEDLGYVEVAVLGAQTRFTRGRAVADVGNLHVAPAHRRTGVARQLLAVAADWLADGDVGLLLAYTDPADDPGEAAFYRAVGFTPLVTTERGWERLDAGADDGADDGVNDGANDGE